MAPCWLLNQRWKGAQRVQMKLERDPSLVCSLGLSCRYKRFLFCHGYFSLPKTNYFLLTVHYFNSFVSIAQQAGQAAVLGRRSLFMCLWYRYLVHYGYHTVCTVPYWNLTLSFVHSLLVLWLILLWESAANLYVQCALYSVHCTVRTP